MSTGVELRALRESRGVSVDRIATATRIPVRMIEALERDDLHALPARPYLRGFVAAYGRELGLDPADAVARYFADVSPPPQTLIVAEPVTEPEGHTGRALLVAVLALAVLLVAPMVSRWRSTIERPQLPVTGTSGTAPTAPAPSAAVAPVVAARAAAPSVPAATDQGAVVAGPRVVYATMEPGATQVLEAHHTIALRVGDAGAATWTINGRPAVPIGRDGEVRTFVVTPANAATIK